MTEPKRYQATNAMESESGQFVRYEEFAEVLQALLELHEFAEIDLSEENIQQSAAAFDRAFELLVRYAP